MFVAGQTSRRKHYFSKERGKGGGGGGIPSPPPLYSEGKGAWGPSPTSSHLRLCGRHPDRRTLERGGNRCAILSQNQPYVWRPAQLRRKERRTGVDATIT